MSFLATKTATITPSCFATTERIFNKLSEISTNIATTARVSVKARDTIKPTIIPLKIYIINAELLLFSCFIITLL